MMRLTPSATIAVTDAARRGAPPTPLTASDPMVLRPSVTVRLLQHINAPTPQRPHNLSARELDVVKLTAIGKTNAEIAQELFISIGTVKTHLASVQAKLDARNRVEIAAWAWESRLVGQSRTPHPVRGRKQSCPRPEKNPGHEENPPVHPRAGTRGLWPEALHLRGVLRRGGHRQGRGVAEHSRQHRAEKEKEITASGNPATCSYEITEDTDN